MLWTSPRRVESFDPGFVVPSRVARPATDRRALARTPPLHGKLATLTDLPTPAPPRRSVDLRIESEDGDISEAQRLALKYLKGNQQAVLKASLSAIATWARETRPIYLNWRSEEQVNLLIPLKVTPAHLMDRVRLYNISVSDREKGGIAYVEYSFGCCWDEEHGILVVLHKNRKEFFGFTGSGW